MKQESVLEICNLYSLLLNGERGGVKYGSSTLKIGYTLWTKIFH